MNPENKRGRWNGLHGINEMGRLWRSNEWNICTTLDIGKSYLKRVEITFSLTIFWLTTRTTVLLYICFIHLIVTDDPFHLSRVNHFINPFYFLDSFNPNILLIANYIVAFIIMAITDYKTAHTFIIRKYSKSLTNIRKFVHTKLL